MMLIDMECKYIYIYMIIYVDGYTYDERHEFAMTNESIDGKMCDERIMNARK